MFRTAGSLLVGMALCIAGCAAPQQADQPADGGGKPVHGGVVNARSPNDPNSWDFSQKGDLEPDRSVLAATYDSLLGFRADPDTDYTAVVIRPELAERWEVSPDASTFTFYLRKGVKFADIPPVNGRELTAADVKWSYEYWARTGEVREKQLPPNSFDWLFEGLQSVEARDPHTVVMRFQAPFAPFLNYSAHDFVHIVPREIFDQDGHYKDRVAGSGSFQLDPAASQKGSRWVLKKNTGYWQPGKPYLDELRILIIPDDSTALTALQVGQLDVHKAVQFRDGQDLQVKAPRLVMFEHLRGSPVHLYVNNGRPPFDNLNVRKAVSLAIDRDEFVKTLTGGRGGWALAGAFPDTFAQEEVRKLLRYDPEEAKRLLREAGYLQGLSVEFEYPTDRDRSYVTDMELLQAQLRKVGITLAPKGLDFVEYSTRKKLHTHTMNSSSKSVLADVDSYLYAIFHPSSGNNYDLVNDPRLNALLEGQRREPVPAKRREIVREAVRYINGEYYCGFAIYVRSEFDVWNPRLKNYRPNFNVNGWAVTDSWLEE